MRQFSFQNQILFKLKKTPKILIGIPCLLTGGTEMYTLDLVRTLTEVGYEIVVCCYYEFEDDIVRKMELAGARVRLLRLVRKRGSKWMHLPHLAWILFRVIRKESPSVFHVQYMAPGLVTILVARLARVPVVFATVHQMNAYGAWMDRMLTFAAWFCDVFFCVSEAVERSWFGDSQVLEPGVAIEGRTHWTVYNLVDVTPDAPVDTDPQVLGLPTEFSEPVVGVVGRLRHEKGQTVLLEAFSRLRLIRPDACLLVVGDGPDRATLEKQAWKLGIEEHVHWAGAQPPEEVRRMYRAMDVVVVSSLNEGFGLVAAEALAARRPVVASDVGGLAEVIRHEETGLLVPPGDPAALAGALERLLSNPSLAKRLATAGQADVRQRFSVERFRKSMRWVYCKATET